MEASTIVVSLEWAKKLKAAGWIEGDAMFCWYRGKVIFNRLGKPGRHQSSMNTRLAAPTVEEILRRFPWRISEHDKLRMWMDAGHGWHLSYRAENMWDESFANAAAWMYCYLAEHKLLPNPLNDGK